MALLIAEQVSLRSRTTLKVGGNAAYYTEVYSEGELVEAIVWAKKEHRSYVVIGGGSNILASDAGYDGLVIHMRFEGMSVVEEDDRHVVVSVNAGTEFDAFVAYTVEHGLWGLENLSHIPGTVGATPVQNVGAYGTEVKNCIESVRVYNTDAEAFQTLIAKECAFGYRDSIFKKPNGKKYLITSVTFRLSKIPDPKLSYKDIAAYFEDAEPSIGEIRAAIIAIRSGKFPDWRIIGTAGSFFKNPTVSKEKFAVLKERYPELPGFETQEGGIKLSLGFILDKILHVRGYREGNVGTYDAQALVLIAYENATAHEVTAFANNIVDRVQHELGIVIEWEVSRLW